MFDWFKSKTPKKAEGKAAHKLDRAEIIAEAQKNARAAREAIGEETLDRLADMIHKKMNDTTSPAAQARKIIEKMDTDKIAEHLRYLRNEPPTKH
ncbi:MAG TPA: hypothetical protein PKI93_06980 [Alphaproteobacteria bacterium]|nr:hypothetical protein [Alphaproteobacteria bacterium]HNS45503.1 hypothetical protein [Alphaproteobacteria bacterium]